MVCLHDGMMVCLHDGMMVCLHDGMMVCLHDGMSAYHKSIKATGSYTEQNVLLIEKDRKSWQKGA